MSNKQVAFKVGTSFKVPILYTPTEGLAPETLEDVTVASQIRTPEGEVIADLTYAMVDGTHFTLEAGDGTAEWPAGTCVEWDIAFSHADFGIFFTETIDLRLVRAATKL